jgi:hypothetical protein
MLRLGGGLERGFDRRTATVSSRAWALLFRQLPVVDINLYAATSTDKDLVGIIRDE